MAVVSFTDDQHSHRFGLGADRGCSASMFQQTWHFLLVALAGFINRQQQDMIAYLQEENRILREKLGGKRLVLNVAQKRRLATTAKKLGRDFLKGWATLFTPETLLHWHALWWPASTTVPANAVPSPRRPTKFGTTCCG